MSTNIYILKLQGGKYYVGKTSDPMKRYQEHLEGQGSAWTKKYKPVSLEKVIKNASPFDEDKYTKEYMAKYGIDKVRGGSYVRMDLDEVQEEALIREIWGANDCCTQCGRKGHFAPDCFAISNAFWNRFEEKDQEETWECENCDAEFSDEEDCEKHERKCGRAKKDYCYRCGREGHYSPDCYASTHKKGYCLD